MLAARNCQPVLLKHAFCGVSEPPLRVLQRRGCWQPLAQVELVEAGYQSRRGAIVDGPERRDHARDAGQVQAGWEPENLVGEPAELNVRRLAR